MESYFSSLYGDYQYPYIINTQFNIQTTGGGSSTYICFVTYRLEAFTSCYPESTEAIKDEAPVVAQVAEEEPDTAETPVVEEDEVEEQVGAVEDSDAVVVTSTKKSKKTNKTEASDEPYIAKTLNNPNSSWRG